MDKKIQIAAIVVVAVVIVAGVAVFMMNQPASSDKNVTYHANGGHKLGDSSDTKDFVSSSSTALSESYEKENEAQFGWNTTADGSGKYVDAGQSIPSGCKNLYAMYSQYMTISGAKSTIDHVANITVTLYENYRGDANYSLSLKTFNDTHDNKIAISKLAKLTYTDKNATSITADDDKNQLIFTYSDGCVVHLTISLVKAGTVDVSGASATFTADSTNHCGNVTFIPDDGVVLTALFSASKE